ncbi:MAG: hypothetical protein QM758_24790 [Armatimonas sp.]
MNKMETADELRALFEAHRMERARPGSVLEDIARNPNSPPDVLALLLVRLPVAFCANPAAPLLLLEHPDMLAARGTVRLMRLLRHPELTGWLLDLLATYPSPQVADAVRHHVACGGSGEFRPWLQEKLTRRSQTLRRWRDEGMLPGWLLEQLGWEAPVFTPDPLSVWQWRELRPSAPWLRCALAAGLENGKALTKAACSYDPAERLGVALNPKATRQRLHHLKHDADQRVRAAALERLQ